ncbi:MAG: hypothetical protein AB9917_19120 [Negativicutes bacterium]
MHFIEGYMEGNAWEQLCVQCYKRRYQAAHYTEIPAKQGGDGGIEGFTASGIVNQCYCPERVYSDNDLYFHQRDKMTADINKLLSLDYAKKLKSVGVPTITEWHFVTPEYKDNRIVAHAETKRIEVLQAKADKPHDYNYISDDFRIFIMDAKEFTPEIVRIIRTNLTDMKVNLAIQHTDTPDWSKCDSEKVANIRRKICAVMHTEETNENLNRVVGLYVDFYVGGLEIMNSLRLDIPIIYEELHNLEQSYKNEVKLKTLMNTDHTMNQAIFDAILNEFQGKLEKDFSRELNQASIGELKQDLVASWLADCSMEFGSA